MAQVGRYRLLELAARGGFGEVWRAEAPDGRIVAVKRLLAGSLANEAQRRRFATEVRALVKLRHPHLVAILDAGEEERAPWLALEWVEGKTLAERLEERGPLETDQAIALVLRVADAVDHAHAQGVLHRDLKPDNVLLRVPGAPPLEGIGEPLLTDFGLARDLTLSESAPSRTGQGLGTPSWWPPEQARGDSALIGPRSDVFGLGGLLYAALTGSPPRSGETLQELLAALGTLPRAPSALRAPVPRWLDAVCLSALDPDPARRPASVRELIDALERGGDGVRRRLALPLGAAGLLACGAVWALASTAQRAPSPAPPAPVATGASEPAPRAADPQPAPREVATVDLAPARQLEQQGRWFEAKEALDAAIAADPFSAEAFRRRARMMFRLGSPRDALADANRAIELDPNEALAHHYRGVAHSQLRQIRAALADFERAIALDETGYNGITYRYRGAMKHTLGDHAGALADIERGLALGDNEPETAHQLLGKVNEALGDRAAAVKAYRRVLELDPNVPWAADTRAALRRLGAGTPE